MEPPDPKAELMRLADEYAQWYKPSRPLLPVARATLETAITQALADERKRALEGAAAAIELLSHPDDGTTAWTTAATIIRAMVDGKAGGT